MKFLALLSSPAGWVHIWVHAEQGRDGAGPELLILPAEALPAGQHWGRVVTSNVTHVGCCASGKDLSTVIGPQGSCAELLRVDCAARTPLTFCVTLLFAVRKRKGGNIPFLVEGALPEGKGSTPRTDCWLLWDPTA